MEICFKFLLHFHDNFTCSACKDRILEIRFFEITELSKWKLGNKGHAVPAKSLDLIWKRPPVLRSTMEGEMQEGKKMRT